MGVDDPTGERGEDRRSDETEVAGEDDDIGLDRAERRGEGLIVIVPGPSARRVRERHEGCLDPLLGGPVEGRARPIGEDEHEIGLERAALDRPGERLEIAPGAADADRDPAAAVGRDRLIRGRPPRTDHLGGDGALEWRLHVATSELLGGGDLADEPGRLAGRLEVGDGFRDRGARDDDHHAEAAVERRPELRLGQSAERPDQAHDAGQRPASRVEPRAQSRRQGPRHVAGEAAAGDVGDAAELGSGRVERVAEAEDRPGVDPRRGQEDVAERRQGVSGLGRDELVALGDAEGPAELLLVGDGAGRDRAGR